MDISVKTSELQGHALDYAVAAVIGAHGQETGSSRLKDSKHWCVPGFNPMRWDDWTPSSDWSQGGPLVEKYGVLLSPKEAPIHVNGGPNAGWQDSGYWGATIFRKGNHRRRPHHHCESALTAAMRAIVQFESGDDIVLPEELFQ